MASELDENGLDKTRSFRILANGTVISHYKIIDKIGSGGMGVVYKAQDTKLDRIVALKFLSKYLLRDKQARSRFSHEATSVLDHTDITAIYGIDEVESECSIYVKHVEVKPIRQLLFITDTSRMDPPCP